MALFRQHLEHEELKEAYPTLNFYCNWTLHSSIDRSNLAVTVLDNISAEFASVEPKHYNDVINRIIGLPNLRADIRNVCQGESLPSTLFGSKSAWRGFVEVLVGLLTEKPVARKPNERTQVAGRPETYAVVLQLGTPRDTPALVGMHEGPMSRWANEDSVFWLVMTNKGATVIGLFVIPEKDSEFEVE